jgi:hypothetical protein
MGFFDELQQLKELGTRTSEAMGGVYSDPFNEVAIITSVSDPKKLGRVKVEYQDGTTSDWVYVLGSGKGLLSAQLIGSSCLIGKAHGNSNDAFVLGFFNKNPNVASGGSPIQLTLLDEQVDSYRAPQSPGDQGMRCNKGNAGRIYLLQNETNQDVVVCMRRNNPQEGGEEVWNWKSLTNSKWVEKGFDPGVQSGSVTNYSEKKGVPECNEAMDGDVRNFSEDRKFRDFQIKCGKDENGDWNWKPTGATPVFFRTTLPKCTEKLHGMDAVLDEGLNSQRISCLRYQGEMKWVNPGKREPIQFHRQNAPITKAEFLDSKKPVEALKSATGMGANDFVGNSTSQVLQAAAKAIPAAAPTTALGAALRVANALPGAFDGAKLLSDIAKTVIVNNGTVPVDSLVSQISSALNSNGVIDDTTSAVLSTLGGAGSQLLRGVQNGTVDSALENIGQKALNQSIRALSPEASSVYFGYMAGGVAGAMDAAAALKLPFIPEEIASVIKPALNIGASALRLQPKAISSMVNSSVGASGSQSLNETIQTVTSVASVTPQLVTDIMGAMDSGDLGKVAQSLGSFSNLATMAKLGGDLSSVPQMASTALQAVGLGKDLIKAFEGGISLDEIGNLLGANPVTGLLSGLAKGLFGGGEGDCPCDPKCRKTEHSEDSDGNILLEKCGNVIANSHSSYAPKGDPTDNNNNTVAKVLDLIPTKLGEELCIPNNLDLTQLIQNVKRLNEMADRLDSAKNADWPELWTEMMYTFETIEKAFKQADNNITKVESVERKLIDAQYRLINKLMVGNGSFFSQTLLSIIETSKAVRDTYNYVRRLDNAKNGGRVGVVATDSLLNVFKNITRIASLNSLSKKEANFITSNFISKADKEWKSLEPGGGLVDITSFVLGLIPIDIPPVFDKCATKRNKSKAINDSLSSKINSPTPPRPESLFDSRLPDYLTSPQEKSSNPNLGSLLDQITYQQGRAQTGEAEC